MTIKEYRKKFLDHEAKVNTAVAEEQRLAISISKEITGMDRLDRARDLLIAVNILTHERVKDIVETLVTDALQVIFGSDYKFIMNTGIKRNKAEIEFFIQQGDMIRSLDGEMGGGVLDVVSFVLRVVVWSLQQPRTSNVIILDEPGKFISKDKQPLFGQLIKDLSKRLSIQFIIVSHEEELISIADKAYNVKLENNISVVEEI